MKLAPLAQRHGDGQSESKSHRRVHMLAVQNFDAHPLHGPPRSEKEIDSQTVDVERGSVESSLPVMHTLPPNEVPSHTQPAGQSLADTQALVQMKDGLVPKHRLD